MLVREYLQKLDGFQNVTFIKAIAQKEDGSSFYDEVYQTTPIRQAYEWQSSPIMEYYILNHKQAPIEWLSGASWKKQVDNGGLISMLVISKKDIELLYSPKQSADIVAYIGEVIQNEF